MRLARSDVLATCALKHSAEIIRWRGFLGLDRVAILRSLMTLSTISFETISVAALRVVASFGRVVAEHI